MKGPAGFMTVIACAVFVGFTFVAPVWVDREADVMGTRIKVEVEAATAVEADRIIDRVVATAISLDQTWTSVETGAELSRVRSADLKTPVALSDGTFALLARAWHLADRTDGAYEPAVGPLLDAWGLGAKPSAADLERAMASVGRRCFDLSPATRTLARHCPDAWIDAGGFAKGAALAAIAQILENEGVERARIDFGGQLLLRGSSREHATITIPDPRDDTRVAFEWEPADGSYATRSQRVSDPARPSERPPILDPRTGSSVEDWGSVTVRSDDPIEADALSTALFVMGPDAATRWLAARPEVEAFLLVRAPEGLTACGREHLIRELVPILDDASVSQAPPLADALRPCRS